MTRLRASIPAANNDLPTRLLIAEDELLLAQALPELIGKASQGQIDVVETVATRDQMFRALRQKDPDVLLCDVRMPNRAGDPPTPCGALTLARVRRQNPGVAVLLISGQAGKALVRHLLSAGADGYIDKGVLPADMCQSIHRVSRSNKSSVPYNSSPGQLKNKLTEGRRGDVLFLLLDGLSAAEIAESLSVGKKYVDRIIREIKAITGANTPIRILRVCQELGITPT